MTTPKPGDHDVEFAPGLAASDGNYLGTDHTQLKAYVNTNLDATQVAEVSDAYSAVQKAFDEFGTRFTAAVNKSQGAWEGDSAEAARGYFTSLTKWSDANSRNAQLASETIYEQSAAASSAKNSMPEPVPFNWNDEFEKWAKAGPLDMGTAVDSSFKLQQQSQQAHEEAANVMSTYDKNLFAAASKQPVFADPPKFGASGSTTAQSTLNSGGGESSSQHELQQGNTVGSSGGNQPGHTTAQGFQQPGNAAAPPPAPANAGLGPMPMGGMGGFGDAEEYTSKLGRGGASGPGESAGASEMGGARKGEGSEDEEHQRPSYLVEGDPDDFFGTSERTSPPVIGE
jgi:hypothetical protein